MSPYILGLDLGENSLGWAAIEIQNGKTIGIIDAGSRVFPEVIERSDKSSQVSNPNQDRRMHRGARRVKARRVDRKHRLLEIMVEAGLFPQGKAEQHELFAFDPYALRAGALHRKLKPHEFGRALYHLAQRRGFKSNRKSGSEDQKEEGKIAAEIGKLRQDIEEAGAQTLGEYLHECAQDRDALNYGQLRLRNHHYSRAMIGEEFRAMWEAQAAHHPDLLTDPLRAKIHDILFFQRDFAISPERRASLPSRANALRAPQLADCSLIPGEKRCSASAWIAQQFRMLKEVNNLRVFPPMEERRTLTPQEREDLIRKLSRQKTMSFNSMRTLLKLPKEAKFNLEEGKRKTLQGNELEATLNKAFGAKAWDSFDEEKKHDIRYLLSEEEDPQVIADAAKQWGLSEEGQEEIAKFKPSGNHLNFSAKAMEILLPYLDQGLDEVTAIIQAREDGNLEKTEEDEEHNLLPPTPEHPNPNINRCLHQTRKIVNALIRKHGKPEKIVVELARDLKMTGKERDRAITINRDNETLRKAAKDWYEKNGRPNPSRTDILAYRLWLEQNNICVYSGAPISAEDLLAEDDRLEIDHILPRSLSLDDSYNNKVLCFTHANRDKGQKTPYQWKAETKPDEYEEMIVRIQHMPMMNKNKRNRFFQEEVDPNKVIDRKLNDTRYASREVAKYLNALYPVQERTGQKRVQTSPGMVTAILRRQWGLNYILSEDGKKNREDHRHHAVDAVVIACTERKHVKALADAARLVEQGHGEPEIETPWPDFFHTVKYIIRDRKQEWQLDGETITTDGLLVSHMPMRKLSGSLHKETNLGIPRAYLHQLDNASGTQFGPAGKFRKRVKVENLSKKNIKAEDCIIDKTIRQIIIDHCREQGIDMESNAALPKNWWEGLTMPSGVPINKVRIWEPLNQPLLLAREKDGEIYTAVHTGNNHHMEIIEVTDKKGRKKWVGIPVTMLEATRRARIEKKPIVQRDHGPDKKFVMSLARNDAVFLKIDGKYKLHRVQKMDVSGKIVFRPYTYAGLMKDSDKPPLIVRRNVGVLKGEIIKVSVNFIGEIGRCND